MGFLDNLFGNSSRSIDYSDPAVLFDVADRYIRQWPDHNASHKNWKPDSLLPAPKWAIKDALKQHFSNWPENPIDETVQRFFHMEFADLARHVPIGDYEALERFRYYHAIVDGVVKQQDRLVLFLQSPISVRVRTVELDSRDIVRIVDKFGRHSYSDQLNGVTDAEIQNVRRILLKSAVEFCTLAYEWRLFVLGTGRDLSAELGPQPTQLNLPPR